MSPGELRLRVVRFVRRAMERLGAVPGLAFRFTFDEDEPGAAGALVWENVVFEGAVH